MCRDEAGELLLHVRDARHPRPAAAPAATSGAAQELRRQGKAVGVGPLLVERPLLPTFLFFRLSYFFFFLIFF